MILLDGDVRRRAETSRFLFGQDLHVEPFEGEAELVASWPKSGVMLVNDRADAVSRLLEHMEGSGNWLPLVAFSENPAPRDIVAAVLRGAVDYLALPFDGAELLETLKKAACNGEGLLNAKQREAVARHRIGRLSGRERQVLSAVASGLSNQIIAEQLGISARTVEVHRANMLNKIGAKHTSDAIRLAVEGSLVN